MRHLSLTATAALAALAALAASPGCDADAGDDGLTTVHFDVRAGDAPFRCGQDYGDVGTSGTTIRGKDMRFYVHDVRFHAASGESVALALEPDGQWQHEEVALLDFEDGTGDCDNGTEETRTFIRGTLPPGDYTGLSFILGVPEALNHIDVATAPAPLNVTKLFWSWTGGYKFLRLDVRSDGQPTGWNVHIGSAKCTGGGAAGPATCELGNRVPVTLDRFDADTDAVVLDVLELFAANDLDVNDAPSAGCMTALDDADCEGIFGQLGLTLDGAEGDPQAVFEARGR